MKKKIIFLLLASIMFSACDVEVNSPESSEASTTSISTTTSAIATQASTATQTTPKKDSREIMPFTYEQALADCAEFFSVIEAAYPFTGVLERKYGVSVVDIENDFRAELEKHKDDMNMDIFAELFYKMSFRFNRLAHFNVLDHQTIRDHVSLVGFYKEQNKTAVTNETTTQLYAYLRRNKIIYQYPTAKMECFYKKGQKFECKMLDEDTAYIRVPQMSHNYKEEGEKIKTFYDEFRYCDNLIIDITGNGGGTDSYWRQSIVGLLSSDVSFRNYFYFKESDLNKKIFQENMGFPHEEFELKTDFPTFDQTNEEDISSMGALHYIDNTIYSSGGEPFEGDIYLLVDEGVYSSAESFTQFCKNTGFATVVGRQTWGDGMGFNPVLYYLKESGFVFRFSILFF